VNDDNLTTIFVDRCVDEINAFHRDERKAQVKTMRTRAKVRALQAIHDARKSGQGNTDGLVDEARAFAREFLVEQYSETVVERGQLGR
jgi:hypothetical protein